MARDGGGEGAAVGAGIDFLGYHLLAFSFTTFARASERSPTHARARAISHPREIAARCPRARARVRTHTDTRADLHVVQGAGRLRVGLATGVELISNVHSRFSFYLADFPQRNFSTGENVSIYLACRLHVDAHENASCLAVNARIQVEICPFNLRILRCSFQLQLCTQTITLYAKLQFR